MIEPGALSSIKVLETGSWTAYAGKLFADHGAEVTLAEPPAGLALRNRPPFKEGAAGPECSLSFAYLSAGKRSVVFDLETAEGIANFKAKLGSIDLVLDDKSQSWWEAHGMPFASIKQEFPELVWCAITPYGQTGPYASFAGNDLTAMAMGGMAWLSGYEDGPVASRGEIAVKSTALYAAVVGLTAILGRRSPGGGCFIDISMQEVVALGTETGPQFYDLQKVLRRRNPEPFRQAGIGVYPCGDGYVLIYAAEAGVGAGWTRLVEWMVESGVAEATEMLSARWATNEFKQTTAAKSEFSRHFSKFATDRQKQELFVEGQRRRIAIAPVNGPDDVLRDPHLLATEYFRDLFVGRDSPLPAPGAPFTLSVTPSHSSGIPPRLGEHQ